MRDVAGQPVNTGWRNRPSQNVITVGASLIRDRTQWRSATFVGQAERLVIAGADADLPIIYGQKVAHGWDFINWWCR
ncbi:hypothetical protein [Streptomyces sp. HUAS TT20]|uniref:hypothetical protein n=1 Tax=Streptomyces sp. HUAS TT20 TaxID=3447509 RepID=UPI0021DAF633|nr:hypothetical protein [Streptomyces sp. HUAS 15-9]UXY31910.1 hypothetical protein N8I87_38770 [Streptomyces sp. HUAS 15-9]